MSLLHDIGYIFEGYLQPESLEFASKRTEVGVNIVSEYFLYQFWEGLNNAVYGRQIEKDTKVESPDFGTRSLGAVARSLRDIGDIENIRKAIVQEIGNSEFYAYLNKANFFPSDAFDLWEKHYEVFWPASRKKSNPMPSLVRDLKEYFMSIESQGIPIQRIRMLDHGVCSGLLMLHFISHWFKIRYGLELMESHDHEDALKRMREKVGTGLWDYNPLQWWTNVVWATGAAAVHNFVQDKTYRESMRRRGKQPHRLSIDEDALAYLGVLVDILSTWDRYSVFIERTFRDEGDPIQSSNVLLSYSTSHKKTVIEFLDTCFVRDIRDELDESLVDWHRVIDLKG